MKVLTDVLCGFCELEEGDLIQNSLFVFEDLGHSSVRTASLMERTASPC